MTFLVNAGRDPSVVPAPSNAARAFHRTLPGYEPTPLHELPDVAEGAGVAAVLVKDESNRLGLPAFKILGASWAVERTLDGRAAVRELVTASAGHHGRAVARAALTRGLPCRIFLPATSVPARREAIEREGAEVVLVDGSYEDAVGEARRAAREEGVAEVADVGTSSQAYWVIEGYATLFAEAAEQADFDLILVPAGVGSLAAAAARFACATGIHAVAVEPVTAACVTASLEAGRPTAVATHGTTMAGLDCAEVSLGAWVTLVRGLTGTITVGDPDAHEAMRTLASHGLAIGDSGAAPLAALQVLAHAEDGAALREAVGFGPGSRVLLLATEGPTDPDGYRRVTASAER